MNVNVHASAAPALDHSSHPPPDGSAAKAPARFVAIDRDPATWRARRALGSHERTIALLQPEDESVRV